jgi:hypothetical protein
VAMDGIEDMGLASAAHRIAAAVAELTGGDRVHPPLAADATSRGAAVRLSTAGMTLAATIEDQAAALADAAGGATLFDSADAPAGSVGVPPPAPAAPDVRPPLAPPPPMPGEVIAHALHGGSPANGERFISGWTRVASTTQDAADLLRHLAAELPELWDSTAVTPITRRHLIEQAEALNTSASRARTIADQGRRHAGQYARAVADVPTPAEFDAVNEQLKLVGDVNTVTGGKYAAVIAELTARKEQLETEAQQGYSTYTANTDTTTAAGPESSNPGTAGTDLGQISCATSIACPTSAP